MKVEKRIQLRDPAQLSKWPVHPLADIYRRLSPDELRGLANSIAEHGQTQPIHIYRGQIIDGRNRLAACELLGIKVRARRIIEATPEELEDLITAANTHRRSESQLEKAIIAINHRKLSKLDITDEQLAKKYGVSRRTIANAKKSLQTPVPRVTIPLDRPRPIDETRKLLTAAAKLPLGDQRDAAMREISKCCDNLGKVLST